MSIDTRTLRRRTGAVATTAIAATAGAALLIPGTAMGDATDLNFTGTAAADPFRIAMTFANFPGTSTPVDSGGPSAQASLSSSGGGLAYSAAPDPGVFLGGLPQLGKGVLEQNGVAFPFAAPDYPLSIQANDEAPSKQVGAGGYELAADVAPSSSQSRTKTGGQTPGGNAGLVDAAAQVLESAGSVAAKAISDVQGLTIGPLSIGSVRSVVSVVADADGNLTRASTFSVDGLKIGNLPVGLAGKGFTVAGQPVPGDQQAILNGLLEAGGVTVEQFPQIETANGLNGAGLLVTHKFETPGLGATTFRYRIGGAAVEMNAGGSPAAAPATATVPGAITTSPAGGVAPGAPDTAAPAGEADTVVTPGVGIAGEVPTAPAAAPAVGAATGEIPTVAFVPAVSTQQPASLDERLYLVIVLAGLLGFGVTRVVRLTG